MVLKQIRYPSPPGVSITMRSSGCISRTHGMFGELQGNMSGPASGICASASSWLLGSVAKERAPRVLSRIVLNPISRFSPRFSYRIIPVLVRFTSFQNPHVAAPRCFHLSHLRRASDQNSNYAVRKTRRAASLAWPGGLEAASTATAACLGGRGPPTAPSCASWTSPLSAPVCFAFRFGDFLLLFLSFALLFGRQPPAEPMFDVYQEAHSGALHRTYRHWTRSTCPPQNRGPLVSLQQVSWPPLSRQAACGDWWLSSAAEDGASSNLSVRAGSSAPHTPSCASCNCGRSLRAHAADPPCAAAPP